MSFNTVVEEEIKKFEDLLVEIDNGPDGDGYDAELPKWNDYFKCQQDECDQIDIIKRLLRSFASTIKEAVRKEDCKRFEEIIGKAIDGYSLVVYKNTSMGDVAFYKTEDVLQLLKHILAILSTEEKMKED